MSVSLLAKPEDVARVLQVNKSTLPEGAEWYCEVASEWARMYLRSPELGIKGEITSKYFDVRSDGYIPLEGTPSKVKVKRYPGATLEELVEGTDWVFDGEGVRLYSRRRSEDIDPRYGVGFYVPRYAEVQVEQKTTEDVNPLVKEGVAQAAAAILTRSPREAKGVLSESIGDYSYAVGFARQGIDRQVEASPFFSTAKAFLRMVPRTRGLPFVP